MSNKVKKYFGTKNYVITGTHRMCNENVNLKNDFYMNHRGVKIVTYIIYI